MALRGILALQSSMAIFFSLLRRVCLSSHMWLRSIGRCNLSSCIIFVAKTVFSHLGWWNFVWNIWIHRRTKAILSRVLAQRGKPGKPNLYWSCFIAATLRVYVMRHIKHYRISYPCVKGISTGNLGSANCQKTGDNHWSKEKSLEWLKLKSNFFCF
jgi:hypothetical protein